MIRKHWLTFLFSTLLLTGATLLAAGRGLSFAAGFIGGTYHQVATTITDLPSMTVDVLETKGSTENITLVRDGRADLGLAQLDVLEAAIGKDSKVASGVRVILPVYTEEVHILAKTSVKSIEELAGKKISIGPTGSGIQATSQIVLKALDIATTSFDESSTKAGLKKLLAGQIDALFVVAGAPVQILKDIDASKSSEIHLLKFKGKGYRKLTRKAYGYKKAKIRRGTYPWLNRNVRTIAVDSAIIGKSSMPDWQVKDLINKVFANQVELFLSHAKWKELEIRPIKKMLRKKGNIFHPAALKLLQSKSAI